MALDAEYFDSIYIDVVKKKYYNANKVEAVFADIRKQAQALQDENAELRRQLAEKSDPSAEITDAVYSAQSVYRAIIERANERAEAILAQAEQQRLAILDENQRQRDYAVQAVERCLQRVRGQQETALNTLTLYVDSKIYGYYFPGIIQGALLLRLGLCIVKAVAYAYLLPLLLRPLRKFIRRKAA